jgi:hypothetical protein
MNKLQKEITFLKEVLLIKQKGTGDQMSKKVIILQEENERLRGMV